VAFLKRKFKIHEEAPRKEKSSIDTMNGDVRLSAKKLGKSH